MASTCRSFFRPHLVCVPFQLYHPSTIGAPPRSSRANCISVGFGGRPDAPAFRSGSVSTVIGAPALLASENVDTNRERHNLSKTQIAQLDTEKKNAAKGVRQQILRTYRHAAWGGSNGEPLKIVDMGQPPATTDQNLTDLVVTFLKDKQKYLEQIAPILLVHPKKLQVWPEEEQALSLKALPNYFRQFTHLPILKDDDVLRQAIVEGVSMGTFALCEGTTAQDAKVTHYKDKIAATGAVST